MPCFQGLFFIDKNLGGSYCFLRIQVVEVIKPAYISRVFFAHLFPVCRIVSYGNSSVDKSCSCFSTRARRFIFPIHLSFVYLRFFPLLQKKKKEAYGLLVRLGLACHHTYTCRLSTQSSPATLNRKIHLRVGFALRCFQRLSRPNIATRRCTWRHNRYTSGSSITVLSY